jgi:hypothetical protein
MYIDCVYGCYVHVYWLCIWVEDTRILIVYIGAICMYIDFVYRGYILFIMYIGALCMYIDCVFGCYIHVYLLCI